MWQDTPGLVTSVPGAVEEELPGLLPSSSDDEGGYDLTSEVHCTVHCALCCALGGVH